MDARPARAGENDPQWRLERWLAAGMYNHRTQSTEMNGGHFDRQALRCDTTMVLNPVKSPHETEGRPPLASACSRVSSTNSPEGRDFLKLFKR